MTTTNTIPVEDTIPIEDTVGALLDMVRPLDAKAMAEDLLRGVDEWAEDIPALATCRTYGELHDHCDANMLLEDHQPWNTAFDTWMKERDKAEAESDWERSKAIEGEPNERLMDVANEATDRVDHALRKRHHDRTGEPMFRLGEKVKSHPDSSDIEFMEDRWVAEVIEIRTNVSGTLDGCCYVTAGHWEKAGDPDAPKTSRQLWAQHLIGCG